MDIGRSCLFVIGAARFQSHESENEPQHTHELGFAGLAGSQMVVPLHQTPTLTPPLVACLGRPGGCCRE